MLICSSFGFEYWPQSRAWGNETCGGCIAERIQVMLVTNLPRTRRPMRRAGELTEPTPALGGVESRRASGD